MKKQLPKKKAKSAKKIKNSDDSSNGSDDDAEPKERKGGFHVSLLKATLAFADRHRNQ